MACCALDTFRTVGDSLGCSESETMDELSFTWVIDRFSSCDLQFRERLVSESFGYGNSESANWDIQLYPMGLINHGWLEAELRCLSKKSKFASCTASMAVVSPSALYTFNTVEDTFLFDVENPAMLFPRLAMRETVREVTKKTFLADDSLTLRCVVRPNAQDMSGRERRYAEDIAVLFLDENKFTDALFRTRGRDYSVHKVILAARSPVFKDQLRKLSVKTNDGLQVLPCDLEPAVAEELLQYVYTGQCSKYMSPEVTTGLYQAASEYRMPGLRNRCSDALQFGLTVDNVCSILILAHSADDEELMDVACELMRSRSTEVTKSKGWEDLMNLHPELIATAFNTVVHQVFSDIN